jgi:TonB family protein
MNFRPQVFFLALAVGTLVPQVVNGQPPTPASETADSDFPEPEWVKLHEAEQGITDPVPIQTDYSLQSDCRGKKVGGEVSFSFVVDSGGHPRNVVFERALANEVDLVALKIMLSSRFHPAILDGSPVAVGRSAKIRLEVCAEQVADQSGKTTSTFRLHSKPEEKFESWRHSPAQANLAPIVMPPDVHADSWSSGLTPPKALMHPSPPDAKGHSGTFSFKVLVDEHGVPQDLQVLKSTDSSLLSQVVQCMNNMRFKPATKNGMPVPAHITEELTIRAGE